MKNPEILQRIGAVLFGAGTLFGAMAFSPALFGNSTVSSLWMLSMLSGVGLGVMALGFIQTARLRTKRVRVQRSDNERR